MLFRGAFNWYGEDYMLYTHAKNGEKAFNNFITQLSKMLEINRGFVRNYFLKGSIDNWSIKEEKED